MNISNKHIIISKTNRIGDVLMGFPVAALLKKVAPNCKITLLTSSYTKSLATHFLAIDNIICWDDPSIKADPINSLKALNADIILHLRAQKDIAKAAKKAKIPIRIGSYNRMYNLLYCNNLLYVDRTKKATVHDMQLDLKYASKLLNQPAPSLAKIKSLLNFYWKKDKKITPKILDSKKFNLILHPKAQTQSGKREWSLQNYASIIEKLDKTRCQIFITGTEDDGKTLRNLLCNPYPFVVDLSGKLNLDELTSFIESADGLIAASTGPLHIAAFSGIHALGFYTPTKGHDPNRWGPIGLKAEYLMTNKLPCHRCTKNGVCPCINDITPDQVVERINEWINQKKYEKITSQCDIKSSI